MRRPFGRRTVMYSRLFAEERAEFSVLGLYVSYQHSDMIVELHKLGYGRSRFRDRGGYLSELLLVSIVERLMRFVSGIAALLLKLFLVQEVLIDIIVQELDGLVDLPDRAAAAASVQELIHRVDKLTVLFIDDRVSRFQIRSKFVFSHN